MGRAAGEIGRDGEGGGPAPLFSPHCTTCDTFPKGLIPQAAPSNTVPRTPHAPSQHVGGMRGSQVPFSVSGPRGLIDRAGREMGRRRMGVAADETGAGGAVVAT